MNFPCDNRRTSRATRRRHMVIRDPVPEVQFRDEEADIRVLFSLLGMRARAGMTV